MNPYLDQSTPRKPNRMNEYEAAGLIYAGIVLTIGAIIGTLITLAIGRWG